ncbi:DUF3043 domain-containing protein [Marmoricola sp. RAF53]|uniref:DUF3043 domain-containing protein n=1 Tax=Marmoricola sp. RAF53 TaxID=3233059 RepID=UPI003F9D469C
MFRRSEKSAAAEATAPVKEGGKGRPTPTRKEAEAASKERARTGMDKKAAQKVLREGRTESNRKMREGMKAGDEKYLPERDRGPVKRYVRNWVDSRITFTEFLLPMLIVIMVLSYAGGGDPDSVITKISSYLWTASILLLLVDVFYTRLRLHKALKAKFPDESLKGVTFYAFIRVLQIRPLRIPKPQVKIGQKFD